MIKKLMSPMEPYQPYIWYADYGENNILTEFEKNGKENEFDIIDKPNLKEFGLLGRGIKLNYDVNTGIFFIARNRVKFYIELEDGTFIKLYGTREKPYNDPIQFKHFYTDLDPRTGDTCSMVDANFFGYKYNFIENDIQVYYSVVFALLLKDTLRFGIHLTIKKQVNGFLVPVVDDKPIRKIPIKTDGKSSLDLEWKYIF